VDRDVRDEREVIINSMRNFFDVGSKPLTPIALFDELAHCTTYMAKIKHVVVEVLHVKGQEDFKQSIAKPIANRVEKERLIMIQSKVRFVLRLFSGIEITVVPQILAISIVHWGGTGHVFATSAGTTGGYNTGFQLVFSIMGTIRKVSKTEWMIPGGSMPLLQGFEGRKKASSKKVSECPLLATIRP
jgi:hypothetical protein